MKNFLTELDTPGGHIMILIFLLLLGAFFYGVGIPKGEDIIVGSFAGLLVDLKGMISNGTKPSQPV